MCYRGRREPHGKGLAKPRAGESVKEKERRLRTRRARKVKSGKYMPRAEALTLTMKLAQGPKNSSVGKSP